MNEILSLLDLVNSFSTNIDFNVQEKGINTSSNSCEMLRDWIDRAIKSMIWLLLEIKHLENQWLGKCEYSMRIIDCTLCIPMMKRKSFLNA